VINAGASGVLALSANTTINVPTGGIFHGHRHPTMSITAPITGTAFTFIKGFPGLLVLNANDTYSGAAPSTTVSSKSTHPRVSRNGFARRYARRHRHHCGTITDSTVSAVDAFPVS